MSAARRVHAVLFAIRRVMGGFTAPRRKQGEGVSSVVREGHQFSKCPQRTTTAALGGWDMTGFEGSEGRTSSVFMMETYIMGVRETQQDPKLFYYPVTVRRWPTQALLDSGASVNCIDEALADKAGRVITHRARGVLLYLLQHHLLTKLVVCLATHPTKRVRRRRL